MLWEITIIPNLSTLPDLELRLSSKRYFHPLKILIEWLIRFIVNQSFLKETIDNAILNSELYGASLMITTNLESWMWTISKTQIWFHTFQVNNKLILNYLITHFFISKLWKWRTYVDLNSHPTIILTLRSSQAFI